FLFQLLKYFDGPSPLKSEIVGAIILPGAVMGFLFLMPFIGKFRIGHLFNVVFIVALIAGAAGLTAIAIRDDHFDTYAAWRKMDEARIAALPTEKRERVQKLINTSRDFRVAKEQAERDAQ